jgi:hypothetical protein
MLSSPVDVAPPSPLKMIQKDERSPADVEAAQAKVSS